MTTTRWCSFRPALDTFAALQRQAAAENKAMSRIIERAVREYLRLEPLVENKRKPPQVAAQQAVPALRTPTETTDVVLAALSPTPTNHGVIAAATGLSTKQVIDSLLVLHRRGVVKMDKGMTFSLKSTA